MGNGVGISHCQQSMKGILWKIDCQLIADEGREGGRVTRLLQSLLGVIRGTLL